jgi:predicted nucleotidyltransferase
VKIREKDKEAIIQLAKNSIKTNSKILAFGSRVNGQAHETSDLDLVIVANDKKKIALDNLLDFKESLQKSNIPIIVQVLDWYRIPTSFHQNILSNYEVLVEI